MSKLFILTMLVLNKFICIYLYNINHFPKGLANFLMLFFKMTCRYAFFFQLDYNNVQHTSTRTIFSTSWLPTKLSVLPVCLAINFIAGEYLCKISVIAANHSEFYRILLNFNLIFCFFAYKIKFSFFNEKSIRNIYRRSKFL